MLAFANLWRPAAAAELTAVDRDQVVAAARQHDGGTYSPEIALGTLFEPERWDVMEDDVARYQVWITGVDSGVVFHARSSIIVGDVIRFGFACNDLVAWEALAEATLPERAQGSALSMIDFALDPAAGPTLFHLDPDHAAASLWRDDIPKLAIGPAWRDLAAVVAPDREIHALVTGSSRLRRSPRHGVYGLASHYPAKSVQALVPRFVDRPADPRLDAIATFVTAAAAAGHDIAVCV
ncbi:MAG TPA: hypothetical protein VIU61_29865 [Kofleriaceae bacterium]